jgi:hypothetical protein
MKKSLPLLLLLYASLAHAQDTITSKFPHPEKYLSNITERADAVNNAVNKQTDQAISRLYATENRIKSKLTSTQAGASELLQSLPNNEAAFKKSVLDKLPALSGAPITDDSQLSTLNFLQRNNSLLEGAGSKLSKATQSFQAMDDQFVQAEQVRQYIYQQYDLLKNQLASVTAVSSELKALQNEMYYYKQHLNEYKEMWNDKSKAEQKAVQFLSKIPAYNTFLEHNSALAKLFALPINFNSTRTVDGLQTQSQVQNLIQRSIGSDPQAHSMISSQIDQATAKLRNLKDQCPGLDNAAEMPAERPNPMKVKTIWHRFEPGFNLQFERSTNYFPAVADIATQLAYLLPNGSIGLGLSYKLGLGTGWDKIGFSQQGIGLRSFLDWKIKGTIYANGGYEENYVSVLKMANNLNSQSIWQKSALVGISKKYKINEKLKGNIMLLYDFLASSQIPKTNSIKVRIGYLL